MNVHMLKGLPGSGKTTMALEMVKEDHVERVNKDDIRNMLHAGQYTPELEQMVIDARNAIIKIALDRGYDVVVDDTNLNPIHQEAIEDLARAYGAKFDIIELDTSVDECIRRDKGRENPVGEDVIRGMAKKYLEVRP
jgi:predicted kinase